MIIILFVSEVVSLYYDMLACDNNYVICLKIAFGLYIYDRVCVCACVRVCGSRIIQM